MAQSKILLDSHAYFRLAISNHPLLFQSFGKANYTLYVIEDFTKELENSSRLSTNFYWANLPEYKNNRRFKLQISRAEKKEIGITQTYLQDYNIANCIGASKVDVRALAYGSVLGIPIVTDDADMISLAKIFGIETWSILTLIRLMFNNQHIDIDEAKQIVNYLDHDNDLPYKGFIKDFLKEFGLKSFK